MEGGIGYSNDGGLQGQLMLRNASVKSPHAVSAEFASAPVLFNNNQISFGPADMQLGNGQAAEVEGEYALDNSRASLKISTRQLTIAEVQESAERVISAPPIPLLEKLRQGTWKGWIAFERTEDKAGVWTGEYELQNAIMEIPGLAAPVRFSTASVEMKGGGIQINRIRAHAGTVKLEGDYRFDPDAGHPHRVRITIPELQLAELERLMLPTLQRNEGFLARTFRLRKQALPTWLLEREVEGSIQVNSLLNGDSPVGEFRAHLVWDGSTILLSNVDCRLETMQATGKMSVNLARAAPAYHLTGTVENLEYRNGQLDIDGDLETSGTAQDLLLNIRSKGTFEGRGIELGPDTQVREITGSYSVAASGGIPKLSLSNVLLSQGLDTFTGQGSSQPDGHIILELTSGRKQVRLSGMLFPMHPEPQAR